MRNLNGRIFPNETSARAAIQAAEVAWVRPTYTRGSFPGATDEQIGTQKLAEPFELEDGRWVIVGSEHPALVGHQVDVDLIKRPPLSAQAQQSIQAKAKR